MRVAINSLSGSFWCAESAPGIGIRQKERLFLREVCKNWNDLTWAATLVPGPERSMKTASVSDVLAKSELPVDMKCCVVRTQNGVLPILVDEARRLIVERSFCLLGPPVPESSCLVVFGAVVIEPMTQFADDDG